MKTLEAIVNPFGKLESESPDNIHKPEFEKDELIESYVKHFIGTLGHTDVVPFFNPQQVNMFVCRLFQEFPPKLIEGYGSSMYLQKIIMRSYENGNNNFVLDVGDNAMTYFGNELYSEKENRLSVSVNGNLGALSARECENIFLNVYGSTRTHFAVGARDSEFFIQGSTSNYCGIRACNCIFVLEGDVGDDCGHCAESCEFRTSVVDNYEKLKRTVPNNIHAESKEMYELMRQAFGEPHNWVVLLK